MSKPTNPKPVAEAIRTLLAEQLPATVTLQFPLNQEHKAESNSNSMPPDRPATNHEPREVNRPRISRSPDFASIRWVDGKTYPFTPKQRPVIAMLWHAMVEGTHFVSSGALLKAAEVNTDRLRDVFRGNKAWGIVIVQGILHGGPVDTFRLAPLDAEGKEGAE
jgi:hypothetical protein